LKAAHVFDARPLPPADEADLWHERLYETGPEFTAIAISDIVVRPRVVGGKLNSLTKRVDIAELLALLDCAGALDFAVIG
jgi:hypothetical protein